MLDSQQRYQNETYPVRAGLPIGHWKEKLITVEIVYADFIEARKARLPAAPSEPTRQVPIVDPSQLTLFRMTENIAIHPDRLAYDTGDVTESYSADRISENRPIRSPFEWAGHLFICVDY